MKDALSFLSKEIYKMDKTSYLVSDERKVKLYFNSGKFMIERELDTKNVSNSAKSIIREVTIEFVLSR
jgi:hypothetical protein